MRKNRVLLRKAYSLITLKDGSTKDFETTDVSNAAATLNGMLMAFPEATATEIIVTKEWYSIPPEIIMKYGTLETGETKED